MPKFYPYIIIALLKVIDCFVSTSTQCPTSAPSLLPILCAIPCLLLSMFTNFRSIFCSGHQFLEVMTLDNYFFMIYKNEKEKKKVYDIWVDK